MITAYKIKLKQNKKKSFKKCEQVTIQNNKLSKPSSASVTNYSMTLAQLFKKLFFTKQYCHKVYNVPTYTYIPITGKKKLASSL